MLTQKKTIVILLLAVLVYFPVFFHLSNLVITVYDEARLGLSAYQMFKGGNLVVVNYEGAPDMWSTKPPLMIWLQAISIRVFGFSELSVRLPSAIAAVFTCIVIFVFAYKFIKDMNLGVTGILVLITSAGYIGNHVSRTGDYDCLLTLLTTLYLLFFFISTETTDKQRSNKFLLYFFIVFTLAILCKGIVGLMFAPAIAVYAILQKKAGFILRQRNFYLGMVFFFVFGVGYYLLREMLNPGYITAVWNNELGGRYMQTIEGHEGGFWYYYDYIQDSQFQFWYLLIPCGFMVGMAHAVKRVRHLTIFISIAILQFFLVISCGQTKLFWYDAPLFPLLSILVAIFLSWILQLIESYEIFIKEQRVNVAPFIFLFLVFVTPYTQIVKAVNVNQKNMLTEWWQYIPCYLKDAIEHKKNLNGYYVVYKDWPSSILFYQKELSLEGQEIAFIYYQDLKPGNKVIVSESDVFSQIEQKFNVEILYNAEGVKVYNIVSVK